MKQILAFTILSILAACANGDSDEWSKLNGKYFEYDKKGLYDSALIIEEKALVTEIGLVSTKIYIFDKVIIILL